MKKEQVDELYHLLRVASNDPDWSTVVRGLANHLLAGGDYLGLIQYSRLYGESFLLDEFADAVKNAGWKPSRIVEFGAGLGWLGRGVAARFGYLPCLFIDKRPWPMIDIMADLETENGRSWALGEMREGDLVVASDFIHCVNDSKKVLEPFSKWPMAILEYCPTSDEYRASYSVQIHRYGAIPAVLDTAMIEGIFPDRKIDIVEMDPYILLLVEGGTK